MHPKPACEQHPRAMTRAELLRAFPERAAEPRPEDWSRQAQWYFQGDQPDTACLRPEYMAPGIWKMEAPRGFVPHLPGIASGRLEHRDLAMSYERVPPGQALRPMWLDKLYLPAVASTRARQYIHPGRMSFPSFGIEWPEITIDAYPYCTIGRVEASNGKQGTGVLVGRNLLLTCSHGAPWGESPWWIKFTPAYYDGNAPFGVSYVSEFRGYRTDPSATSAWDYIVCRLYNPLGDRCGYMGYYGTTDDDFYLDKDTWITVGFPGTQRPQTEFLIDIDDVDDDGDASELETPWDSRPGWSGGPLFGWLNEDPKVVGVVSGNEIDSVGGWLTNSDHGLFAGGLAMARLISWARANWP